jgi:hypothetical protein
LTGICQIVVKMRTYLRTWKMNYNKTTHEVHFSTANISYS